MENSISYETMMDVAVRESLAREIKEINSLKKYNIECNVSDDHKKAINRIIKQKMHRNTWYSINAKFSKVAVIILIMLVSTFTPVLTAEAVKKSIAETLLEWKDQVTRIFINTDDILYMSLEDIEIEYITEGFKLAEKPKIYKNEFKYKYINNLNEIITIKIFFEDNYVADFDNTYTHYSKIKIGEDEGIFTERDNIRVLVIEHDGIIFYIKSFGNIEISEIINIYKNINIL